MPRRLLSLVLIAVSLLTACVPREYQRDRVLIDRNNDVRPEILPLSLVTPVEPENATDPGEVLDDLIARSNHISTSETRLSQLTDEERTALAARRAALERRANELRSAQ